MSASAAQRRRLPSQLTLRSVHTGDEGLVRSFFPADREQELVRTGVLGPPNADGLVDISIDQFVAACIDGLFLCVVTFDSDGTPLTLYYGVMVGEGTLTGGCLNAPAVPGGQGIAAAGVALALDFWLTGEVRQVTMSVFGWNHASLGLIRRIGFTPAGQSRSGTSPEQPSQHYVLAAADWRGSAQWEAELLAE